ncbi:MAG: NAD(P)H-dependent glycerol-3-phosphate dehydrogenase [Clostridiales bacterium]
MEKRISLIGAGSWGTALAVLLESNGHDVSVWSEFHDEIDMLNDNREHIDKLPGVKIPENIVFTKDLESSILNSDIVVLVVPSHVVRQTVVKMKPFYKGQIIVCCAKGIEEDTGLTMSKVIESEIKSSRVVILSGPTHAEEVSKFIPTTIVAASKSLKDAEYAQSIFMNNRFRVYTNHDVIGVELGGSLKNVIALCAGISDGLGYGDNTKAALMTRGIAEISRLGTKLGANINTFSGLSGVGDLIVTCTSMHSRNRRAGILIGKGKSMEEAIVEVKMVVEGITTTKAAYMLAKKENVGMPIILEAYNVLFNKKDPSEAVNDLMTRDKKYELDVWGN